MESLRNLIGAALLASLAGCGSATMELSEEQAKKQLDQGLEAIAIFDYGKALTLLQPVPAALPVGSREWQKATFALASSLRYYQPVRGEYVLQSVELYELLLAEGDDPVIRGMTQIELGRIFEISDFPGDEVDLEKGRDYYRAVIEERPAPGLANEAVLRLGNSLVKEFTRPEEVEAGIALVRGYLEEYPDNAQNAVMWQFIAMAEDMVRNDPAAALDAYDEAKALGFAVPSKADNYLWIMVRLAKQTGDDRRLVRYCQATLRDTPRSAHGTLARLELERLQKKHPDWDIEIPRRATFLDFMNRGGSADAAPTEASGQEEGA
ncbi:MAG: hypothetical protein AAGK14_13410 [Verrucomicrobiota bacterium]